MNHDMQYSGKVAMVTGAAGGIGSAIVAELGRRGISVAAVDREVAALTRVAEACAETGAHVQVCAADVGSTAEIGHLVDRVENELGPIEYLVNAAGVLHPAAALDVTEDEWDRTFEVNARGVYVVTSAVTRAMVSRSRGAVVTIGSNASRTPRMGMAVYAATKAAATMYTKCLGLEVARYGIRCNVVSPGSTDTPMLRSLWSQGHGEEATVHGDLDAYRVGIPLGRIASSSDIANAVAFLLSDHARHITMHDLTVDGGAGLGV
ncbi:2,3-dihydro-2,3-dihydroxybenzoate dehydrogenase [Nocardia jejuensis]|uniref:2,3-dihydro-2,3-dihydroxybenzoate dehydrogenase n=1 Tax=Nocardia jejuensis TaxID=328049 RepID=UPI0009FD98C7|nr:2,3-dihydro-2,3-dihydroxybenzoate dehydrogenase [Nocardia jejuensis]